MKLVIIWLQLIGSVKLVIGDIIWKHKQIPVIVILGFLINTYVLALQISDYAFILSIEGELEIFRHGWLEPQQGKTGAIVYSSDGLWPSGKVTYMCSDGTIRTIVELAQTILCDNSSNHGTISGYMLLGERNSYNGDQHSTIPYIIYPRRTIVRDTNLRVKWNAILNAVQYEIRLIDNRGVITTSYELDPSDVTSGNVASWESEFELKENVSYSFEVCVIYEDLRRACSLDIGQSNTANAFYYEPLPTFERAEETIINILGKETPESLFARAVLLSTTNISENEHQPNIGAYGEAINLIEQIVLNYPESDLSQSPNLYNLLGSLYQQIGLPHSAARSYAQALELATEGTETYAEANLGLAGTTPDTTRVLSFYNSALEAYLSFLDHESFLITLHNVCNSIGEICLDLSACEIDGADCGVWLSKSGTPLPTGSRSTPDFQNPTEFKTEEAVATSVQTNDVTFKVQSRSGNEIGNGRLRVYFSGQMDARRTTRVELELVFDNYYITPTPFGPRTVVPANTGTTVPSVGASQVMQSTPTPQAPQYESDPEVVEIYELMGASLICLGTSFAGCDEEVNSTSARPIKLHGTKWTWIISPHDEVRGFQDLRFELWRVLKIGDAPDMVEVVWDYPFRIYVRTESENLLIDLFTENSGALIGAMSAIIVALISGGHILNKKRNNSSKLTTSNIPKVFISYRREVSAGFANTLHDQLENLGASVFIDVDDIPAGSFSDHIKENIMKSDYVIVVLAPDSLKSEWVVKEVLYAHEHNKVIIPVLVNNFDLYGEDITIDLQFLQSQNAVTLLPQYVDAAVALLAKYIGLGDNNE